MMILSSVGRVMAPKGSWADMVLVAESLIDICVEAKTLSVGYMPMFRRGAKYNAKNIPDVPMRGGSWRVLASVSGVTMAVTCVAARESTEESVVLYL